jgi:RND family efflux transporter MFP subunit
MIAEESLVGIAQHPRGRKSNWIILGMLTAVGVSWVAHHLRPNHAAAQSLPGDSTISANGNISSNGDVFVSCQACGEVIRLPFSLGDPVKKGDIVCQLDPAIEQNAVDQAHVALSRAMRKLEETSERAKQAQADLEISIQQADESINSLRIKATNVTNKAERQKHLLSRSATSQEDYETAQTDAAAAEMEFRNALLAKQELKNRGQMLQTEQQMNIETAQDAVDSAKITLKNAEVRLASTTMVSPIDGVVSDVKTAVSGWIVPSGEFGRQAVITISDLSHIFVDVSIDQRQIGFVENGQAVEIRTDSYPGREFAGVVARVAPTGVSSAGAVAFAVRIEVTSPDKALLKPPISVNVRIVKQTKDEALIVPTQAVKQNQSISFATEMNGNGGQHARTFRLGMTDGSNDEIPGGLGAGDRVVVRAPVSAMTAAQNAAD